MELVPAIALFAHCSFHDDLFCQKEWSEQPKEEVIYQVHKERLRTCLFLSSGYKEYLFFACMLVIITSMLFTFILLDTNLDLFIKDSCVLTGVAIVKSVGKYSNDSLLIVRQIFQGQLV